MFLILYCSLTNPPAINSDDFLDEEEELDWPNEAALSMYGMAHSRLCVHSSNWFLNGSPNRPRHTHTHTYLKQSSRRLRRTLYTSSSLGLLCSRLVLCLGWQRCSVHCRWLLSHGKDSGILVWVQLSSCCCCSCRCGSSRSSSYCSRCSCCSL